MLPYSKGHGSFHVDDLQILCRVLELARLGVWCSVDELHLWYGKSPSFLKCGGSVRVANTVVQMYSVTHSDFEAKQWHVFVAYIVSRDSQVIAFDPYNTERSPRSTIELLRSPHGSHAWSYVCSTLQCLT